MNLNKCIILNMQRTFLKQNLCLPFTTTNVCFYVNFCHNPNIEFVTKCEVQRPMRPRVCLGVKHTLTNGGKCKG